MSASTKSRAEQEEHLEELSELAASVYVAVLTVSTNGRTRTTSASCWDEAN
ncbi:MAG: hypothetical protein U0231_16470 [Nitrospiraceae bacterium]